MTKMQHMPEEVLYVVPCTTPGLTCCPHMLLGRKPAENVQRCEVWCTKWRLQRDRETRIHACDPDFPK